MSDYRQPVISTIGVTHEKELALIDARDIIHERGDDVVIKTNIESAVNRDTFGSIKSRTNTPTFTFKAYPINFSPTDEQRDNAGLKERTQVIVYTAMQDWMDEGYTLNNLRQLDMIKWRLTMKSVTYEIRDKALNSQFSDTYLYVTLGLNKV